MSAGRPPEPAPTRRELAIAQAADLLREGGPRALTSVAVAERMGVTQSAVYRHVRNMEELSGLAAAIVVAELNQSLKDILFDPEVDWDRIDDVGRLCGALIDQMVRNRQSFEMMARWRFAGGALGDGIRTLIEEGVDLVASLLETRWRVEFGGDTALGPEELNALRAHARAMHDDIHAVARLASASPCQELDREAFAAILVHRVIAGWTSFVIDLNQRVGLPFPEIELADIAIAN